MFGEAYVDKKKSESSQAQKLMVKSKFKKLLDFNGLLINKMNSEMNQLNEEEIVFYNKLVYRNL